MRTDLLLRRTRMHFPRLDVDQIRIRPIEKGGSDRKFYRIRCSPEQTLILVKYNLERDENRHYVQIARFLDERGIRVPKIYFDDPAEGLVWIEDLGESDLYSYRRENWLVRRAFYDSALDQIATLHSLPESTCVEMKEYLPADKTAIVDPSAQLRGWTVVGRDCRVGAGAILEDAILWPGAEIASKSYLQGCIVRSKKKASGTHRNIDI